MNRWKVIRLEPGRGLGSHAQAWDALNQRTFHSHPMLDSRFVDALLVHFGTGTIVLCVLAPDHEPQAMCLLRSTRPGLWSTFLPSQAQIGPMILEDPAQIPYLLPKLPGYALRVDLMCVDPAFCNFKVNDPLLVNRMDHALTMGVSLTGSFDEYWASRPKSLIKNIARYLRRVSDDGLEHKLIRISESSEIECAVERYARLESAGWKGKEGTSVGSSENQQKFYSDVMMRFTEAPKEAIVYELWLGDGLAASRLVVAMGDMFIILKTTYDENLSRYAPGRILLYLVIGDLFCYRPGKNIEFYTDANSDQLAWASERRWIAHWTYHRNAASVFLNGLVGAASGTMMPYKDQELGADNKDTICVYRGLAELPEDVKDFFGLAEADDFQFGLDWYQNLADTVFPEGDGIYVFGLRRGAGLIACIPVFTRRGRLGFEVESLGNFYTTLYSPHIDADVRYKDLVPLVQAIPRTLGRLTSMRFSAMDPEAISYRRLKNALHAAGMAEFGFFCFGNWYLPRPQSWQSYLAGLRANTRSTIKRMNKKFTEAGGTLQIVTDADEVPKALAAYEIVYASSWKQPEPFPGFVPGLVRLCQNRGWLRMGVAWLDGKPVAAQLWIVANNKANIYKLAYDENFKQYTPGTVLTAALMEHVIEKDGVQEVDFLAGDDAYKRFWMSDRRERWGIIAYNPRTLGGVLGLLNEVSGRALKPVIARVKALIARLKPAAST